MWVTWNLFKSPFLIYAWWHNTKKCIQIHLHTFYFIFGQKRDLCVQNKNNFQSKWNYSLILRETFIVLHMDWNAKRKIKWHFYPSNKWVCLCEFHLNPKINLFELWSLEILVFRIIYVTKDANVMNNSWFNWIFLAYKHWENVNFYLPKKKLWLKRISS